MKHVLSFILTFWMSIYCGNAQMASNNQFLESLTAVLFSETKEEVEVTTFFGHEKQNIDSTYSVRKVQPKLGEVMPILKKIAYSADVSILNSLVDIYDRQQSFFKQEWEPVHRNNFYACEAANEQFSILEAFEEAIHSLRLKGLGLKQDAKVAYFKDYLRSQYDYYHVFGAWPEAIKGWHIYSPYYMMLRENRWVGPPLGGFSFMEPYIGEIEAALIDDLVIHFKNLDSVEQKLSFEQFELDQLCRVVGLSENAPYNESLIKLVLSDKRGKSWYVHGRILSLLKNPKYKDKIKATLLESTKSEYSNLRLNSLNGLLYFHDIDVITQYQSLLSDVKTTELEKKAIEAHLSILDRQLNASAEAKEMGKTLLMKMKN